MALKLILISPDGTIFADKTVRPDVAKDLVLFIQRMSAQGVHVAIWSRTVWNLGDKPLQDVFSSVSGVPVKYFRAGVGALKVRQASGSADPILASYGIQRHECILLGGSATDMQAAVNNKLLLIRPAWYEEQTEYGFKVSSVGELARFCEVFGLRKHPIYWQINEGRLHVATMGPFSTMKPEFADFGESAKSVAKHNTGLSEFWFLLIVSSVYFSGIAHSVDYITAFPGHDPNSYGLTRKQLDAFLTVFGKCFSKTYFRDLIIRHTKSDKSQYLKAHQKTFANQLNTIHLNLRPMKYDSNEARKTNLPLKGKTVLVVDDILTNGRSLDTSRAYINAAGGEAILFAWLKTINTDYHSMNPDPTISPFVANSGFSEPSSKTFSYHGHVTDPVAPDEIQQVLDAYRGWKWP